MRTEKPDVVPGLNEQFVRRFGAQPLVVQAPGRVNLIGEHTDYNDGFVLPAAIQFRTTVAVAARQDGQLLLESLNYNGNAEFGLSELPSRARNHWSDYVIGVARKLLEQRICISGATLLIQSDVPQGAGLSSSASIEVAVARALLELTSSTMNGTKLAQLCQSAENEFVGTRCGIMDQFVAVHAKPGHALLLDCRALTHHHQPVPEGVALVICNSMVRHALAGGEYNLRRKECEVGAQFFAARKPGVRALRDVSMEDFLKFAADLPEPVRRRCRHVIAENARVLAAAEDLKRHDLQRFGELMYASHASLRDDFQVSCRELDVLVELACKIKGVYGARMTGGGFGGCTINLVESREVDSFRAMMAEGYERATATRPEIYVCSAGEGVKRVA